ncbi:MAG TPA: DUF501 domain-containing protein [Streptosporangiaceae bacterium]|nr:DUF501 domain-containing protein [Streptosporangiaceae bacterium]
MEQRDRPEEMEEADRAVVAAQLGRTPRAVRRVAHRCRCGLPDVIETAPRLPDGTPFPTLYYLTCPKANSAIGSLEAGGVMRTMTARLAADPALAERYRAADADYRRRRDAAARADGIEPLPAGTQTAGGMPDRVKCLHALVAHELAVPGVNPFGREALDALPAWWRGGPCVRPLCNERQEQIEMSTKSVVWQGKSGESVKPEKSGRPGKEEVPWR